MSNKDVILDLYYNQHLKQIDIAQQLNLSKQYVSKVINTDSKNNEEKEQRKQNNLIKRSIYLKDYLSNYKRTKKEDNTYKKMLEQQKQDSYELSYSYNALSDYTYRKWNPSAYHTNSKGNLVLNKGLNVGFDVPKSINMNLKVPIQKYKNRFYC